MGKTISGVDARKAAQRLINSHFRQEPTARISVPARPEYDDDLVIMAYIKQAEADRQIVRDLAEWHRRASAADGDDFLNGDAGDGRNGHDELDALGKRAAGRLLDGREWNEVPE